MNLKEELKKRILVDVIKKCRPEGEFVVFVVDAHASKIVSSCCRMYDIMDSGVIVLESLSVKREQLDMPAIYLLDPNQDSIQKFIDDYKDPKKPQYTVIHLFLTSHIEQGMMEMIANSHAVSRIKTFTELNCDFVALESRVFSFERRKAISRLYLEDTKKADFDLEINKTVHQLVSVLLTCRELPYIRYQNSSEICKRLAKRVEEDLNKALTKLKDWKIDEERERGTLFIVDRSLDPTAPLMHEYTYQAMLNDLLDVNGEICTIKTNAPAPEDIKGKPENKSGTEEHVLSEEDPLWIEYRHQHIGVVISTVTQKFHEFRNKNAAAIFQSANKDEVSLKDMNAAIQALPQYQYMIRQYRKHMAIAETCMDIFDRDNLQDLSELEQDIATGLDADAQKVNMKAVMEKLSKFFADPKIDKFLKLRLLMIYITAQGGIDPTTRKTLLETAGIPMSSPLVQAVSNLKNFGVDLMKDRKKAKVMIPKERLNQFADRMKKITLKLMRYVSVLDEIMAGFVKDALSTEQFPYIKEPPPKPDAPAKKADSGVTSLRKQRNWRDTEKKDDNRASSARLFMFVVGGVTFAELRSAYEIGEREHANLVIGSTEMLTAKDYIRALGNLDDDPSNLKKSKDEDDDDDVGITVEKN